MCWSCNPICGGCRPPRKRPVKCPECGMFNAVDLEHFSKPNPCTKCGFDLTDLALPEPVTCTICGEVCYNPCRKGKTEQPDGSFILRPYAEQLSPDRAPEGSDIHAVFNGYVSIGKVKSMVLPSSDKSTHA